MVLFPKASTVLAAQPFLFYIFLLSFLVGERTGSLLAGAVGSKTWKRE
jgi:hypothetical protein